MIHLCLYANEIIFRLVYYKINYVIV